MLKRLSVFLSDDRANATAEYGVVAAVFGIAVIASLSLIQNETGSQLTGTQSRMTSAALSVPTPVPTPAPSQ